MDYRRNKEGYIDMTAYSALQHMENEREVKKVLKILFSALDLTDYEIVGRIKFRNKKTGEIFE